MSSEIKTTNIKHADSASNNLVLGSDGSATINQISSSTAFPFDGTTDAGRVIQIKYIDSEETNALDNTYTVRWNYSITLKSSDSKILIIHTDNPFLSTGNGLGRLIFRHSSAFSDGSTTQTGTRISEKAPNDGSPYMGYMGASNGYPVFTDIVLDDVSSSFNAGDIVYYGHYYRRYVTATAIIPAAGVVQDAHFSTIVMELEK